MAESKQYVTQNQENGSVLISEDVIAAIIASAISEVDSVCGLAAKAGADIAELIGKKNWGKGLKIVIQADDTLDIDCNVNVLYGQNVVAVAKAAQEAVIRSVESITGVSVNSVNVNVCGIVRQ